jgi:hypothetical protein
MAHTTDFLLLQIAMPSDALSVVTLAANHLCASNAHTMVVHRSAWSSEAQQAYVYLKLSERSTVDDAQLQQWQTQWAMLYPSAANAPWSRLELMLKPTTASRSNIPTVHYVVETDVDEGWMPEIVRWYDTEHMPGLAAVPGCVSAMRLINHDHGHTAQVHRPRSFACYDLTDAQVLGSPAWLAVRHTAWSDIARPHFCNTLRTMFYSIST